ncbi:MAG: divalent cation tolerance protein CutA [Ruminococcaceae bacterium]|nr:divalent cation tolerance protein CutA [Oscillospiraceae bacterium]
MEFEQAKIEIYIPPDYVVPLRDALSEVGAGHIGAYDHCVSITQVSGYWRPLEDAKPFLGELGQVCEGTECKVEVRCRRELIPEAVRVIRKIHPYEEPVINIVPLANHLFGVH